MSSVARVGLIDDVTALKHACDLPPVLAQDAVGNYLRRGLTVASFNTLEAFVAARWSELTTFMNSGHVQFEDLPDDSQVALLKRTMEIGLSSIRWTKLDGTSAREYFSEIGNSLARPNRTLGLHGVIGGWKGSNLTEDELASPLKAIGIVKPWPAMECIMREFSTGTSGPGGSNALKDEFLSLGKLRNQAAHEATGAPTALVLRTIPDQILRIAFCFDVVASIASVRLHQGQFSKTSPALDWESAKVPYKTIEPRSGGRFALKNSSSQKASSVRSNLNELFSEASRNLSAPEYLVQLGQGRIVENWSIGLVG